MSMRVPWTYVLTYHSCRLLSICDLYKSVFSHSSHSKAAVLANCVLGNNGLASVSILTSSIFALTDDGPRNGDRDSSGVPLPCNLLEGKQRSLYSLLRDVWTS